MPQVKHYGLNIPARRKQDTGAAPVSPRLSIFEEEDDNVSDGNLKKNAVSGKRVESRIRQQTQLEIDKAIAEDATVFQYDEIYDEIQSNKPSVGPKSDAVKDRKSKYIGGLMKAAKERQKEYERRLERQVQKERELEGDIYGDKESFVTSAYKNKMEEMRLAEEEERRKDALDAACDVTKQRDMSGFYRYLYHEKTKDIKDHEHLEEKRRMKEPDSEKSTSSLDKKESESDDASLLVAARKARQSLSKSNSPHDSRRDNHQYDRDYKEDKFSSSKSYTASSGSPKEKRRYSKEKQYDSSTDDHRHKHETSSYSSRAEFGKSESSISHRPRSKSPKSKRHYSGEKLLSSAQPSVSTERMKELDSVKESKNVLESNKQKERFKRKHTDDQLLSARERYMQRRMKTAPAIAVNEDDDD